MLANIPAFFIFLLSVSAILLFSVWLTAFKFTSILAFSVLSAYLSKRAMDASAGMDSWFATLANILNFIVFCGAGLVFALFVLLVAISIGENINKPWTFYVDAQGRWCMRGKFLYRWSRGGQEKSRKRRFNGTIEEFLAFNRKWQPCQEQERYRIAATKKLESLKKHEALIGRAKEDI